MLASLTLLDFAVLEIIPTPLRGIPESLQSLMLRTRETSAEQKMVQLLQHHQDCISDAHMGIWEHVYPPA